MKRREFLKAAGAASAASLVRGTMAQPGRRYAIVMDANDAVAGSPAVRWAAEQLRGAIAAKGGLCQVVASSEQVRGVAFYVIVAAADSSDDQEFPQSRRGAMAAENVSGWRQGGRRRAGHSCLRAATREDLSYGLLELAERVRFGANPDRRCIWRSHSKRNLPTKCVA